MNAKLGMAAAVLAALVACGDKAPPAPGADAEKAPSILDGSWNPAAVKRVQ